MRKVSNKRVAESPQNTSSDSQAAILQSIGNFRTKSSCFRCDLFCFHSRSDVGTLHQRALGSWMQSCNSWVAGTAAHVIDESQIKHR